MNIRFIPLQVIADAAIAECVEHESSDATLTTADGRVYRGSIVIDKKEHSDG